ncbi:MAG: hypothetical protein ACOYKD_10175 [Anaerolineaceae bacterium]|jgi:hypothetical protein
MKIRTDFVTNSSSYNSSSVIIDNPVLLEILKKYDDMGTFDKKKGFSIGKYENFSKSKGISEEDLPTYPAFAIGDNGLSIGVPSSLNEVVEFILYTIDQDLHECINDPDLFAELKAETEKRREEIMSNYEKVIWDYVHDTNEDSDFEGYIQRIEQLIYDPVRGEDYRYIREVTWSVDGDIEEGFILDEKRILNGKVIKNIEFERGYSE